MRCTFIFFEWLSTNREGGLRKDEQKILDVTHAGAVAHRIKRYAARVWGGYCTSANFLLFLCASRCSSFSELAVAGALPVRASDSLDDMSSNVRLNRPKHGKYGYARQFRYLCVHTSTFFKHSNKHTHADTQKSTGIVGRALKQIKHHRGQTCAIWLSHVLSTLKSNARVVRYTLGVCTQTY